ncbi:signal peptidase I [Candidatus Woesearchaeota archaeon]|nr:signal peptidase I [Candidatus Woesearchaeota archaeon]
MKIKKIWNFIWHDDSWLAWFVNLILAFIIVKFIIYPLLGFALATNLPVVAVISGSMEHPGSFNDWWQSQESWYTQNNISLETFKFFPLKNGFNKGDVIFLTGHGTIEVGDVIVFQGYSNNPIIHRVVKIETENNKNFYTTKGDFNRDSSFDLGEVNIPEERIIGKAVFKVPYLGWIKILFSDLVNSIF